ncbi:glycosyltransferase [Methylophaga sp. SB9B]|nr:glycosyltransferase [Methylophaga sp. SB9B]
MVSRLVEKKGVETLIKAMGILNSKDVDFSVIIYGDGPLKTDLINLTKAEGLDKKIEFRGEISHSEVPKFISSLSVFVLPCKVDKKGDVDGIPVVLMESMALGVPVISTTVSGIPELIEDGVSGYLCEPDDYQNLSLKINKVFQTGTEMNSLLDSAKQKVKNEYLISHNAQLLYDCISRSVENSFGK